MTMTHAALVAIVHGLQIACLVTWIGVVLIRGGSLLQVMFHRDDSRWHQQWSSITLFGATQAGFCGRWLIWGDTVPLMSNPELSSWAVLYCSSTISAIGVVISHGWWNSARHRTAMILHVAVVGLSVLAAGICT